MYTGSHQVQMSFHSRRRKGVAHRPWSWPQSRSRSRSHRDSRHLQPINLVEHASTHTMLRTGVG